MKFPPVFLYTGIPTLAAALVLLGVSTLFSGCYTLKQGASMLGYLNRAIPLKALLDLPPEKTGDPEENRVFVERVRDIRRFAQEELGLRHTANYTRYVAIDQDYLAAVVSASAQDSFSRHEWWFPVVGKVPYKGFFNPDDARREREKLQKKGLDVWIRGVDAFSTLGWFKDPLYSYMRRYPVNRLADLLIHETLHATVFLKGQVQFNEELAEFVGSEGSRLYMERTFGLDSAEYRAMIDSEADSAVFIAFIQELIAELEVLYRSNARRDEKLQKKEEIIKAAQARFDEKYETLFRSENYRGFSKLPVNNAYLELYRLYYAGGSYLEDLYDRSGRDLPHFIAAVKTLTGRGDPRAQLEAALGLASE
ncbi:aminopeptidase [Treponema sp. TIM-1]|uniref:aminopeptidase n=1 Tax=Treponema sp. TIM-1 TaxID=2898417 RepID=UPI00397EFD92